MVFRHAPVENLKKFVNELSGTILQKWLIAKIVNVTYLFISVLYQVAFEGALRRRRGADAGVQ